MPDLSDSDRDLLVRTVLGEAADQGAAGQAAVVHVALNRLASGKWGDTVPDVLFAKGQWEPWQTRARELAGYSPKSSAYKQASQVVDRVLSGEDRDATGGATHFLDPKIVKDRGGKLPDWAKGKPLAQIGAHQFFAPDGRAAPQEDLLGSWQSRGANTAAPSESAEPDLLGAWQPKEGPPATVKPPPSLPAPTGPEGNAEALARAVAAHQGDSWTDRAARLAAGVGRGVGDVGDTLAQAIAAGGSAGAGILEHLGAISPQARKAVQDWRTSVNEGIDQGNRLFDTAAADSGLAQFGRVGGQIAGTAPFMGPVSGAVRAAIPSAPRLLTAAIEGAGIGAGSTALTSASSDAPLTDQMAAGAETGAVLGPLGRLIGGGVSRLAGAGVDPETARLASAAANKYDIPIRVDQISANPMVRFAGSVLQRLPFTGLGKFTGEQQRAFNSAIANEFGETADKITGPVMQRAKARIGAMFDSVAQRTGNIPLDRPFVNDVRQIVTDARTVLGDDARPVENQIARVLERIRNGDGVLDADAYQSLTRKDTPLDRALNSPDPNVRFYIGKLRSALDDMMQRAAPADAAADLKEARYQWAVMKAIEPLAKKATTGDISPALVLGKSKGGALEEIGRIGQRFLKEPPSSGTAERLSVLHGLGAIAGGGAGLYAFDPEHFQRDVGVLGAALLAGRAAGGAARSQALTRMLIRSGQGQQGPLRLSVGLPALSGIGALTQRSSQAPAPQSAQ